MAAPLQVVCAMPNVCSMLQAIVTPLLLEYPIVIKEFEINIITIFYQRTVDGYHYQILLDGSFS